MGRSTRIRRFVGRGGTLAVVIGLVAMMAAPMVLAATPKPELDLGVTKVDSEDPVQPEAQFDYIIDIVNNGPSAAFDVWIVDTLPPEVTYVSGDAGCSATGGNKVECSIGAMAPGDTAQRTLTVQVNPGVQNTTILNIVRVENREDPAFAPVDNNPANNRDDEPTTIPGLGSIGDRVWIDTNADGVQDPGEVGYNGATVTLSGDGTGTDTTAGDGNYLFDDLAAGNYTSALTVPAGFTATTPTSVDVALAAGEDFLDADFGIVPDEPGPVTGQIGDRVWLDENADGVQDASEVGINGVTLTLSGAGAGTDVTEGDGDYLFTELPAGTYTVTVTPPAGYTATTPTTVTYDLAEGEIYLDADFGFVPEEEEELGSIGDFVWSDLDNDGVQDPGEPGIGGVTIILQGAGNVTAQTTTSSSGLYLFDGLAAGTYTVSAPLLVGSQVIGTTNPPYTITNTAAVYTVNLAEGEDFLDADYPYVSVLASAQIGDTVCEDLNGNGVPDAGEPGIEGVTLNLTGTDVNGATVEASQITNADGLYLFAGLEAGTYVVAVGSTVSLPGDGDTNPTSPTSITVTLADGEIFLDADFCYAKTIPVTGFTTGGFAVIGTIVLGLGVLAVASTRTRRTRRF